MTSVVWMLWGLTTAAAVSDLVNRTIPNTLVKAGAVGTLFAMVLGEVSWWHVAWAVGIWGGYELRMRWFPGTLGWGDVKWATVTVAVLGPLGLCVVLVGHAGVYVWGTVRWLWRKRREPWRGQSGPWAPGAWVGLTAWLTVAWTMTH